MTEHKATPGQWNADRYDWARADTEALDGNSAFRCIMELRSRVEALEAAAKPAESNYPAEPDSSLVKWLQKAIGHSYPDDACTAILVVAEWVDRLGYHTCAVDLRNEVPLELS